MPGKSYHLMLVEQSVSQQLHYGPVRQYDIIYKRFMLFYKADALLWELLKLVNIVIYFEGGKDASC